MQWFFRFPRAGDFNARKFELKKRREFDEPFRLTTTTRTYKNIEMVLALDKLLDLLTIAKYDIRQVGTGINKIIAL